MYFLRTVKANILHSIAWYKRVNKFITFLKRYLSEVPGSENHNESNGKTAFVVMPWMVSAVPFFVLMIGLFINRKGRHVHFIVDTFKYGRSSYLYSLQARAIVRIVKLLNRPDQVIDPRAFAPVKEGNISGDEIRQMAMQCTIHYMKGELVQDGRNEYYANVLEQLSDAEPFIHSAFKNNLYDYIYFPGGIHATSCLYHALAKKYQVRINTFDSDFGVFIASTNGIAAHLSDIPVAFNLLKSELTNGVFMEIRRQVREQIDQRSAGVDHFNTQTVDQGEGKETIANVGCLIILNVSWDAAALNIHSIFDSYHRWLLSTIQYLLEQTTDNITIRQHPHERFPLVKGNDDFEKVIAEKFNNNKRIQFVNCYAKVNTYGLINGAKFVVAFSSTSGVEAVVLNKPVILASNCYYANLGFVFKPASLENYYELLLLGSALKLQVNEQQINDSYLCYYLGICCNLMFTDFTPVITDFEKWVKNDGIQIFSSPKVQLYLSSIDAGVPLAYLKYRELLGLG